MTLGTVAAPYLAGLSAASAASMAFDEQVQQSIAAGIVHRGCRSGELSSPVCRAWQELVSGLAARKLRRRCLGIWSARAGSFALQVGESAEGWDCCG